MDYAKQEAPQPSRQSEIGSEMDAINGNLGRLETAFQELESRIHQVVRDSPPSVKDSEKQNAPSTKFAQELRACNERLSKVTSWLDSLRNRVEL